MAPPPHSLPHAMLSEKGKGAAFSVFGFLFPRPPGLVDRGCLSPGDTFAPLSARLDRDTSAGKPRGCDFFSPSILSWLVGDTNPAHHQRITPPSSIQPNRRLREDGRERLVREPVAWDTVSFAASWLEPKHAQYANKSSCPSDRVPVGRPKTTDTAGLV